MIRLLETPEIITALKDEIKFLPDNIIKEVSRYFNFPKSVVGMLHKETVAKGILDLIRKLMIDDH